MRSVRFLAQGHKNILGTHATTLEITSEDFLTKKGTCIVGIKASQTLASLSPEIKSLASLNSTAILLRMTVEDRVQEIHGRGSPGLTYRDSMSMVARTSSYECGRTLMVEADRAAIDLDRSFVNLLKTDEMKIVCEIEYISE